MTETIQILMQTRQKWLQLKANIYEEIIKMQIN